MIVNYYLWKFSGINFNLNFAEKQNWEYIKWTMSYHLVSMTHDKHQETVVFLSFSFVVEETSRFLQKVLQFLFGWVSFNMTFKVKCILEEVVNIFKISLCTWKKTSLMCTVCIQTTVYVILWILIPLFEEEKL